MSIYNIYIIYITCIRKNELCNKYINMGSLIHNDSFITLIYTNIAKAKIYKKELVGREKTIYAYYDYSMCKIYRKKQCVYTKTSHRSKQVCVLLTAYEYTYL